MLVPLLALTLLLTRDVEGRIRYSSTPEDTFAFPKLRVNFINNLPLSPETAQKWLSGGLKGGLTEFLGEEASKYLKDWPQIDDGSSEQEKSQPTLKRMRLGPERSFACLIPPTSTHTQSPVFETPIPEQSIDPLKSWALLQPLAGTCLYHRQGWFTYAYCHNSYVRQFRELEHSHPHPPGGWIPKEDPEYEGYTLGRAPELIGQENGELTVRNERHQRYDALQLAQGRDQRYLTSKWTGGTLCDKTGRAREIEIQFHCGMTTTDAVQFIKETSLCKYLLVIHSPRLCGEPGFKSARDFKAAAPIQCREIVEEQTLGKGPTKEVQSGKESSPYPPQTHFRNPNHLPDLDAQQAKKATVKAEKIVLPTPGEKGKHADTVEKLVTQMLSKQLDGMNTADDIGLDEDGSFVIKGENGDELVVQLLDLDGGDVGGDARQGLLERLQATLKQTKRDDEADKKNKKGKKKSKPRAQQDNNAWADRNRERDAGGDAEWDP